MVDEAYHLNADESGATGYQLVESHVTEPGAVCAVFHRHSTAQELRLSGAQLLRLDPFDPEKPLCVQLPRLRQR
jgi:hypothetical protein